MLNKSVQLKHAIDPFGEVNVKNLGEKVFVRATILMEPHKEGAQTGIALDGSGSMEEAYGTKNGFLSSILNRENKTNQVSPVAQAICSYLARKLDADGGTSVIYWATGQGGGQIDIVGDLTAKQAESYAFSGPKNFGTATRLCPAVKYFVEKFKDAPYGFYVFITDGEIHDLEEVKRYTTQLAKEIQAKKRHPLKFVLVGVGNAVKEEQMIELDDLDTGTNVDLWDHKIAKEMRILQEIFAEVVDENAIVANNGKIFDSKGQLVKDYSDTGLPALLEFECYAGDYFTLEVNGNKIHQPLSDNIKITPPTTSIALKESTIINSKNSQENLPFAEEIIEFDITAEIEKQKNK